jgi:hypothetical protein
MQPAVYRMDKNKFEEAMVIRFPTLINHFAAWWDFKCAVYSNRVSSWCKKNMLK